MIWPLKKKPIEKNPQNQPTKKVLKDLQKTLSLKHPKIRNLYRNKYGNLQVLIS